MSNYLSKKIVHKKTISAGTFKEKADLKQKPNQFNLVGYQSLHESEEYQRAVLINIACVQTILDNFDVVRESKFYGGSLKNHCNLFIKRMEELAGKLMDANGMSPEQKTEMAEQWTQLSKIQERMFDKLLTVDPLHYTSLENDLDMIFNKYVNR